MLLLSLLLAFLLITGGLLWLLPSKNERYRVKLRKELIICGLGVSFKKGIREIEAINNKFDLSLDLDSAYFVYFIPYSEDLDENWRREKVKEFTCEVARRVFRWCFSG